MTIESTNDNNSTNTAITYSECYAQVFLGDCLELYKNIKTETLSALKKMTNILRLPVGDVVFSLSIN